MDFISFAAKMFGVSEKIEVCIRCSSSRVHESEYVCPKCCSDLRIERYVRGDYLFCRLCGIYQNVGLQLMCRMCRMDTRYNDRVKRDFLEMSRDNER